jgi:hypothetical protein
LKAFVCLLALVCAAAGPVKAQTAEHLDALLDNPALTYAQAAQIVLPAAGLAPEDISPEAAFAEAQNYLPGNAEPGGPVRLGELAFLIMRAFNLKGGICYSLFPGPRYAYRELVHRGFIQGRNDPALCVSGERLLRILGRVLDHQP